MSFTFNHAQSAGARMLPAALGASLWLDEAYGVTEDGAGALSSWSCRLGNGDALPFGSPFTVARETISSNSGQGMQIPETSARTLFFIINHRGYPEQSSISSLISDSINSASDSYIFLNGDNYYEISLDGRINREGRYRRIGASEKFGGNVGNASLALNQMLCLTVRYADMATDWRLLGSFIGSNGSSSFSSLADWHQICLFENELSDAEVTALEQWAQQLYTL